MGVGLEIRRAIRNLMKSPGSSATAVVVLGMGIGLSSFMYSVILGHFGRGLGLPDEDQVVTVRAVSHLNRVSTAQAQAHILAPLLQGVRTADVAAFTTASAALVTEDGPIRLSAVFMTPETFGFVSTGPSMGRFPATADLGAGDIPIVLSHASWQRDFGGRVDILGTEGSWMGRAVTVVGVMEEGFGFPSRSEVWIPLPVEEARAGEFPGGLLQILFRLRDGATVPRLQSELTTIAVGSREANPQLPDDLEFVATELMDLYRNSRLSSALNAMVVTVVMVLLVACVNVANLLLARVSERSGEVGIRTALGGGTGRVVLPFLMEALILAVAGGMVGLLLAFGALEAMDRAITPELGRPYYVEYVVDTQVLGFTLVVAVITALMAGVIPALRAASVPPGAVLRDGSRTSTSLGMSRLVKGLVVFEVALSAAVLVGAGVAGRSIFELATSDLGFDPEPIMTARIDLLRAVGGQEGRARELTRSLTDRLADDPELALAALSRMLPGRGGIYRQVEVEGVAYDRDEDGPRGSVMQVSRGFFDVAGAAILQGRDFLPSDDLSGAERVVLIDAPLAQIAFPAGDAVGRRIRVPDGDPGFEGWHRIVGIVPDITPHRLEAHRDPGGLYFPIAATDVPVFHIIARTPGVTPDLLLPGMRAALADVAPEVPLYRADPLPVLLNEGTWFYVTFGSLFLYFGIVAICMAGLGLHGVVAFSVSRRRREFGVRMALGADAARVVGAAGRQAAVQVALGLALGLGLGWYIAGAMQSLAFRTNPRDPTIYVGVVSVVLVVSALATLSPVLRAVRTQPVAALRSD